MDEFVAFLAAYLVKNGPLLMTAEEISSVQDVDGEIVLVPTSDGVLLEYRLDESNES